MADIIPFPHVPRSGAYRLRMSPRPTVRFGASSQLRLPLSPAKPAPEDDLEQRIQAAKATAAFYEERAAKDTDRRMLRIHEKRAADWNQRVLDLVALKNARSAQADLLPAP